MGFSLTGLGKKLEDVLGGVVGGAEHAIGGVFNHPAPPQTVTTPTLSKLIPSINQSAGFQAPNNRLPISLIAPPPVTPASPISAQEALRRSVVGAIPGGATIRSVEPALKSQVQGSLQNIAGLAPEVMGDASVTPGGRVPGAITTALTGSPTIPSTSAQGSAQLKQFGVSQKTSDKFGGVVGNLEAALQLAPVGVKAGEVLGGGAKAAEGVKAPVEEPVKGPITPPTVEKPSVAQSTHNTLIQNAQPTTFEGNIGNNLEENLRKVYGNKTANDKLLSETINSQHSPTDLAAAYHYAEDPTSPVTPAQRAIYENEVKPLQIARQTAGQAKAEAAGENFTPQEGPYIHRIAQGKNSSYEQFLNEDRRNPTEGAMRKTVDSDKGRVMQAVTDEEGNRRIVSIKTAKDKFGNATGKRVVAWENGTEGEDLGGLKVKSKEDLLNQDIKPLQKKLGSLGQQFKALQRVRVKGGDTSTQMTALARKVAAIRDNAEAAGRGLTKPEGRSVRLATLKGKSLGKVKLASSNTVRLTENLGKTIEDTRNRMNQIVEQYNPDELKDKVFIGKDGKRYSIGEATTKEIEGATKVRYYKNPVANSAIDLANTVHATNATNFMNWLKSQPDFEAHFSPSDTTPPKGWVRPNTPYLKGYYTDPKTAELIDRFMGNQPFKEPGIIKRTLQGFNTTVVKTIVASPAIHGLNQEWNAVFQAAWRIPGSSIKNMGRIVARQVNMSPEEFQHYSQRFYRSGGVSPEYGKDTYGFIAKGLKKAGINPANAELSPRAMAAIEEHARVSIFKTAVDNGMSDFDAVKVIDHTLGGPEAISDFSRTFGLFVHYLKMNTKLLGSIGTEAAKGNLRPLMGAAIGYTAYMAANKAWQEATGNPNAKLHGPGFVGTAIQLAEAPGQAAKGQIPSVVTSHVNPGVTLGVEEATNRNLRSPLFGPAASRNTLTGAGNTSGGRLGVAESSLFGPGSEVQGVATDKMSLPEAIIDAATGARTPHAKGAPAAPNLGFMNTSGATPVKSETVATPSGTKTISDPTGYQQQTQYYNALDHIDAGLKNPTDKSAADNFIMRNRTDTGQTVNLNQSQSESNWHDLASNPDALKAVQQFYQAGGDHNPEWDLKGNGTINGQDVPKIQLYAVYKALPPGDLQRAAISQENSWISDTENAAAKWGAQLPQGKSVDGPGFVKPPTYSPAVQDMMNQVTKISSLAAGQRTSDQIKQLSTLENNPDLQAAYQSQQDYTNAVRKQMNLPEIQYAPKTPPEVQNWTTAYMAATKAQRNLLRTQNPKMYNAMQASMEQSQLASVEKYGGEAYYGANVPDTFLGGIYGLGNYDITKGTNPNGTSSYALTDFTGNGGTGKNNLPYVSLANSNSSSTAAFNKQKSSSGAKKIRMAGKTLRKKAYEPHLSKRSPNFKYAVPQAHKLATAYSKDDLGKDKIKKPRVTLKKP